VIETVQHEGWKIDLVGAELGIVGFVFEGRPNVLADATGVLRGGNTVVFRIGRDALRTARAMMDLALEPALREAGLPAGSVCLIDSPEHAAGWALFSDRRLALAVARGSGQAVATLGALARQAGIPVSLHGTGGAWLFASDAAPADAFAAAVRASLDRKVCNTLNVCCIAASRAADLVPVLLASLAQAGAARGQAFKLHVVEGDERFVPHSLFSQEVTVRRAEGDVRERQAELLPESSLGREWEWEETPEISLKIVDDLDQAASLFNRLSPQFIASLISSDPAEHERFYAAVNAPFVGNGFTRWVDGQYALNRPELGLSNWQGGRLFGRGGVLSGDSVFTVRARVAQSDPEVSR
jgi:glutamate-5-semialdehyde dehydrogenase